MTSIDLVSDFELEFLGSELGLVMNGLPCKESGERYVVDGSGTITSALVRDLDGNSMIKACADPEQFEENYKEGINALMSGREVLEMLVKLTDVKGVLVCSAASFNSFPIYRERAELLLSNFPIEAGNGKRWWKFWS